MFCQNCSAENAEDDRFCCQCGSPLRVEEQESGIEKDIREGRSRLFWRLFWELWQLPVEFSGWWDREFPRQEQR